MIDKKMIYGAYGMSVLTLIYTLISKNSIFLLVAFGIALITFIYDIDGKVKQIQKDVNEIILKYRIKEENNEPKIVQSVLDEVR